MNIGKRRIRYAALAAGAAVLASLTISGGGPPGGGQSAAQSQTPPMASKGEESQARKTATTAAPRSAATSRVKSRTIRVETGLKVGEELDLGARGRSVGDQFIFSGNLFSTGRQPHRVVGRVGGFCVITDLERNAGQCSMTAVLAGGQLTVQGELAGIPTPKPGTIAITGGTGEFRNAQGQMALKFLTPPVWELTFEVTGR